MVDLEEEDMDIEDYLYYCLEKTGYRKDGELFAFSKGFNSCLDRMKETWIRRSEGKTEVYIEKLEMKLKQSQELIRKYQAKGIEL